MKTRRTAGQAFVETAIGIVVLLFLTFSVIDAGMLFFAYLTLQNGVTEATRIAVTGYQAQDPNDPSKLLKREETVRQLMRVSTPGLGITDNEIAFYDVTNDGTRVPIADMGNPESVIQVTVTHPWHLVSPLFWPFVGNGGRITLRASATMKNEPFPSSTS
jgi:Flp pilus assembly protein TadG